MSLSLHLECFNPRSKTQVSPACLGRGRKMILSRGSSSWKAVTSLGHHLLDRQSRASGEITTPPPKGSGESHAGEGGVTESQSSRSKGEKLLRKAGGGLPGLFCREFWKQKLLQAPARLLSFSPHLCSGGLKQDRVHPKGRWPPMVLRTLHT